MPPCSSSTRSRAWSDGCRAHARDLDSERDPAIHQREVAGGGTTGLVGDERRVDLRTDLLRTRAAQPVGAAGVRDGGRASAGRRSDDLAPLSLDLRIWMGIGREQRRGARVQRGPEETVILGDLDDLAAVEHHDAVLRPDARRRGRAR